MLVRSTNRPSKRGIGLDLGGIDGEAVAGGFGQEAAVAGIADQRLVALCQLAFETGEQRGARLGVLAGLFRVAAEHVAPPAEHDLLDGEIGLALLARDGQRHRHAVIVDHRGAHLGRRALAHAEDVVDALCLEHRPWSRR